MKLHKPLPYKRSRSGKTSYKKRRTLLLSGKPRVVVRFTQQRIIAQLVAFAPQGDKIIAAEDSSTLGKKGWPFSSKNTPAAYLTGILLGKKALQQGVTQAVLDTGFRTPLKKGKLYAFLKGVKDAGMDIPSGEGIFPDQARVQGAHIAAYLQEEHPSAQFTQYLKSQHRGENLNTVFEELRQKTARKRE